MDQPFAEGHLARGEAIAELFGGHDVGAGFEIAAHGIEIALRGGGQVLGVEGSEGKSDGDGDFHKLILRYTAQVMASLQAHVTSWMLRRKLKPKLARAADALEVRRLMRPEPMRVPAGVRITAQAVGGVAGEWVEGNASEVTLLYLHGGGYVACSAKTHRPITVGFAQHGLRVFAPDYRMAPEHLFPAAVGECRCGLSGLVGKDCRGRRFGGRRARAGDADFAARCWRSASSRRWFCFLRGPTSRRRANRL